MQKKLIIFFALLNDVLKFTKTDVGTCNMVSDFKFLTSKQAFLEVPVVKPQICRSWRRFESEMNCQPQCQCDQEKNK